MAEDLSPIVRVGEIPPKVRNIQGVATSTFATVGLFQKGPIGVPTFVAGPEDVKRIFGEEIGSLLGRKALGKLFSNGGTRGYITRVAHYSDIADKNSLTALLSKVTMDDRLPNAGKAALGNLKVVANLFTSWLQSSGYIEIINNTFDAGDKVTINGVDFEPGVDFTPGVDEPASALALMAAINGSVDVGIDGVVTAAIDISNSSRVVITAVVFGTVGNALTLAETDGATDNFTLSGATLGGGIDGDYVTVDSDQYNFGEDIIIGASLAATAAAIQAVLDGGTNVGAQIDATDSENVLVSASVIGLAGNAIVFTKQEPGNSLTISAGGTLTGGLGTDTEDAASIEAADGEGAHANGKYARILAARNGLASSFRLEVRSSAGVLLDSFENVNMDPNSADYAETRINGKSQKLIKFIDEMSANTVGDNNLPALGDHIMIGGDDGLVGLNDIDFIGDPVLKTGIYSWDTIEDKFAMSSVPDRPISTVQKFAHDFAESKKHFLHFVDAPNGLTPQQVVTWKNDNGISSEYGALHYPWITIQDRDPAAQGAEVEIPNSLLMIALYARVDNAVGKGVAKTAAGVNDGRIFDIVSASDTAYDDKGNRDLVFPEGVNPIWSEQGVGVINDGGRLTKLDGLVANVNERRVFIFCETSIKLGTRFARHENIDEKLFNALDSAITAFLTRFWKQGGLKGATANEAFYVDASFGDGTINPPSSQEAQKVNVEIGLATKKPGYFIEHSFTIDQRALLAELGA